MPSHAKKPALAALGTVFLWAFVFPASKAALPYFTAEQVVLLRYLTACLFYVALFACGMFARPQWRDVPMIFVFGLLGVAIYQLLFVHGVARVAAGAAAIILSANPVFAALLARIFLREKLSVLTWCGIGVSFAGVALITFGKGADGEFVGYLLLILAVLVFSFYFVFQKPYFARYSPLAMTAYTSIAGTLPLLFFLPQTWDAALLAPAHAWFPIVGMGIFSSGIGFVLWFYALSKLPAGIVASFLFLLPVCVTLLAWVWLDEIPPARAFVGGAITLAGVALILRPGK